MNFKNINDLIKAEMCTGCGLCVSYHPKAKMIFNKKGFLIPDFSEKDLNKFEINQKLFIEEICPGNKTYSKENIQNDIWGDYQEAKLYYSTDEEIRFKGSSGGTITEILRFLLDEKIVDYVIHIQKDGYDAFHNIPIVTNDIKSILENTGSKYCPTAPLENIKDLINSKYKYAFVGRPCDIVGLENLQKFDEKIKKAIKYKISFFCAGAPSIKGTEKILEKFNLEKNQIKSFRYRGNGWPGETTIIDFNNKVYTMLYNDSWGKILNRYLPSRCKLCPDGVGMSADVVFGDGWDCDEKGYPKFDEKKGKSLGIIRNKAGKELMEEIVAKKKLYSEKFDEKGLKNIQPYQYSRRISIYYRVLALKIMLKKVIKYEEKIKKTSRNQSLKLNLKSFLGTLLRIFKGRI